MLYSYISFAVSRKIHCRPDRKIHLSLVRCLEIEEGWVLQRAIEFWSVEGNRFSIGPKRARYDQHSGINAESDTWSVKSFGGINTS
jgi:hypothetical protein